MPLKNRFITIANAVLPDAWHIAFREATGVQVDADEDQWRKLTGDAQRDLSPMTQQKMQKIAHYLWEANLLANRIIELPVAYLLAEGVALKVDGESEEAKANQATLDRFWADPINQMDLKLPKKVRELALFGEQVYPAFANEHNGAVRLGYLDPSLIETVVKDPDNPEQPIGIVTVKDRKGRARRYRVVINGDEDAFTSRTQSIRETFADGDAFYFQVNDLSSGSRGRSDLLAQADWLDGLDQFMWGELDRAAFLRAFIWDVTLKNADRATVEKRAKEIRTPSPGTINVHNDSELWEAMAPELKGYENAATARLFRNHVLGGASLPEHWFGGGGDVNRATAAEMGGPTFKMLAMRQRVWKHILESIGRYVLMKKASVESAKPDWSKPEWRVQAVFPDLVNEDVDKFANALSKIAIAAAAMVENNFITKKTALALIALVAGRLGLEIDADKELLAAEAELAKRREQDAFTEPPEPDGGAAAGAAGA